LSLRASLYRIHRSIADPARRGPLLAAGRALLWPAAAAYGLAVRLRNILYDRAWLKAHPVAVPVISVGNITAGGTGKTPFVAWLARFLVEQGRSPAILSRGYGRDRKLGIDDENRMLGALAPGVPIIVNPDRIEGARTAVARSGADVLILDDGFQHRRIARDLDIVLLDATMPFGGRHLLPRGYLRERPAALRRADVIVLTRTDLVDADRLEELKREVSRLAPDAPFACAVHRPCGLEEMPAGEGAQEHTLERLTAGEWGAFCGLGNPDGFLETLKKVGTDVLLFSFFPDHHRYRAQELKGIFQQAAAAGCEGVITTQKDAVRVATLVEREPATLPLLVLKVEIDVSEGRELLQRNILRALGRA